jgi:hypothetical protein
MMARFALLSLFSPCFASRLVLWLRFVVVEVSFVY